MRLKEWRDDLQIAATVFSCRGRGFSYVSLICMRMKLAAPGLFSALVEADIDAVLDKKASHAPRPRASIMCRVFI